MNRIIAVIYEFHLQVFFPSCGCHTLQCAIPLSSGKTHLERCGTRLLQILISGIGFTKYSRYLLAFQPCSQHLGGHFRVLLGKMLDRFTAFPLNADSVRSLPWCIIGIAHASTQVKHFTAVKAMFESRRVVPLTTSTNHGSIFL